MPRMMFTILAVFSIAALQAQSGAEKPAPPDVGAGRVAWFDLTTTNVAEAKQFYAALLDWTFTPLAGSDQAVEIVAGGQAIGTLRKAEGAVSAFNGVVYVQVGDMQATCAKAKALGATIPPGFPFNLTDRPGAIALLLDPTGHPIGLYSRSRIGVAAGTPFTISEKIR